MPGVGLMGRPKKGTERNQPTNDRVAIIHLKGTPEYAEWLDRIHGTTHIPKATIFRLALADWAEKHGHPKPPDM